MSVEPNPEPRRKLSEQSKSLLKREVQRAEDRLEAEFQRPFEMRKEAEIALAQLPPWPAILCVIFGALMALIAVPSAFSYHSLSWERQHKILEALQLPEQIEAFPAGNNWRAFTLVLPFAAIPVGLAIWGRRHRLAYLGLGLYGFAMLETALVAVICEWSDAKERQLMAMELRVRLAEVSRPQEPPPQAGEEKPVTDEQKLAMDELRYRLEEEQQQRRMADLEAVQKNIRDRMQAERAASAKAEQERLVQEAERKKVEAREQEEAERRRKEEERRQELALKEMRAVELQRAQETRAQQRQEAQERLAGLTASHDEASRKKNECASRVEALEARLKAFSAQQTSMLEQIRSQEELVRGADQVLVQASTQRNELTNKLHADGSLKRSEDKALKQAEKMFFSATQMKAATQQEIIDTRDRLNELQLETQKLEKSLLPLRNELEKAEAAFKELDTQITRLQAQIRDLKD